MYGQTHLSNIPSMHVSLLVVPEVKYLSIRLWPLIIWGMQGHCFPLCRELCQGLFLFPNWCCLLMWKFIWPRLIVCGVGMHVQVYSIYMISLWFVSSALSWGGEIFASLLESSYPIGSFIVVCPSATLVWYSIIQAWQTNVFLVSIECQLVEGMFTEWLDVPNRRLLNLNHQILVVRPPPWNISN